jgi:hypothetical protein
MISAHVSKKSTHCFTRRGESDGRHNSATPNCKAANGLQKDVACGVTNRNNTPEKARTPRSTDASDASVDAAACRVRYATREQQEEMYSNVSPTFPTESKYAARGHGLARLGVSFDMHAACHRRCGLRCVPPLGL